MEASGASLLVELAVSEGGQRFRGAFSKATGLPLRLLDTQGRSVGLESGRLGSALCALIDSEDACSACCRMRASLAARGSERQAGVSAVCPAGLQEALVPIRADGVVIGFLQTGQVRLNRPTEAGFRRLVRWLTEAGVQPELEALRKAYFDATVLNPTEYAAMLSLLEIGAEQLGSLAQASLQRIPEDRLSAPVRRACLHLRENAPEPIGLTEAARVAGLSREHFCRIFKRETGHTVTEFLTLVRVEAAADRLREPGSRISEVALAVGFQSISQFNRSFRAVVGKSPTDWRSAVPQRLK